jgi:hypothetical protein
MLRVLKPRATTALAQASTYTRTNPASSGSLARIVGGPSSQSPAEYSDLDAFKFSEKEAERVRGEEERGGYVWVAWKENVGARRDL